MSNFDFIQVYMYIKMLIKESDNDKDVREVT